MLSNAMFDVGGSFGHSTVIGAVINPVKWGLVSSSSSSNMGGCRAVRGCTAVVGEVAVVMAEGEGEGAAAAAVVGRGTALAVGGVLFLHSHCWSRI